MFENADDARDAIYGMDQKVGAEMKSLLPSLPLLLTP
jgi:hypothetical protein